MFCWAEGGREGEGTTVNVFQNDVTWNNDANLSKPLPPSIVPSLPRGLLGIAELVLITLFPNLGIGRARGDLGGSRGAHVCCCGNVSQSSRTSCIHPQLRLPLPSSLCEQEFLMWVSSSLSLFILIRGYRCPHLRLHPLHMVVALTRPCLASADTRLALRK